MNKLPHPEALALALVASAQTPVARARQVSNATWTVQELIFAYGLLTAENTHV